MRQQKQHLPLGFGEYIVPDPAQNTEIQGSRWKLMEVVRQDFPLFFKQLRGQVYPEFARQADKTTGYWERGWTFETWQLQSDRNQKLGPLLIAWAKSFHAEEPWILEGALQSLWLWHKDPEARASLDISGFRSACSVDTLVSDEERELRFEFAGWDPQMERWASYSSSVTKRFRAELDAYEQRLRTRMESQGAVRARARFREDHFLWFVLYQFRGMSATKILRDSSHLQGDESTILKGIQTAAKLLKWNQIRKFRKSTHLES